MDLGAALREAAALGDAPRLRSLLAAGARLDATDSVGRTCLHYASQEGQLHIVEELLRAGAQVNAANRYGGTPLHSAAKQGHAEVIGALLRAGARTDARTEYGQTPLHRAAEHGHAGAVAALLANGAAVDAATRNGETPLHRAAEWGHAPAVRALLRGGAEPRRRLGGLFGDTATPLELAQRHGHAAAACLLREAQEERAAPSRAGVWRWLGAAAQAASFLRGGAGRLGAGLATPAALGGTVTTAAQA